MATTRILVIIYVKTRCHWRERFKKLIYRFNYRMLQLVYDRNSQVNACGGSRSNLKLRKGIEPWTSDENCIFYTNMWPKETSDRHMRLSVNFIPR